MLKFLFMAFHSHCLSSPTCFPEKKRISFLWPNNNVLFLLQSKCNILANFFKVWNSFFCLIKPIVEAFNCVLNLTYWFISKISTSLTFRLYMSLLNCSFGLWIVFFNSLNFLFVFFGISLSDLKNHYFSNYLKAFYPLQYLWYLLLWNYESWETSYLFWYFISVLWAAQSFLVVWSFTVLDI